MRLLRLCLTSGNCTEGEGGRSILEMPYQSEAHVHYIEIFSEDLNQNKCDFDSFP